MRKLWFLLALLVVGATSAKAQTTYQASNVPFVCLAATGARVPLSFGMFFCRGIYFDGQKIELFFGSQFELYNSDAGWLVGPYTATQNVTTFTQPNPTYCPVKVPGYIPGCPSGMEPGTLMFNWSGTDGEGVQHSGSVSATWINEQFCGGKSCWYHPVIETISITVNN